MIIISIIIEVLESNFALMMGGSETRPCNSAFCQKEFSRITQIFFKPGISQSPE
jgi:hypothetical protein